MIHLLERYALHTKAHLDRGSDARSYYFCPTRTGAAVDKVKVTRALLSVSDKAKLVEMATALVSHGVELLSTGGTAKASRVVLPLLVVDVPKMNTHLVHNMRARGESHAPVLQSDKAPVSLWINAFISKVISETKRSPMPFILSSHSCASIFDQKTPSLLSNDNQLIHFPSPPSHLPLFLSTPDKKRLAGDACGWPEGH